MTATAAEVIALNRDLSARLAARDARPPVQSELPPDHPARPPLGLAPAPGDDDSQSGSSRKPYASIGEPAFASGCVLEGLSEATRQRAATLSDVALALDSAIAIGLDGEGVLHARIVKLEIENARDKATIAELRSKVAELDFVSERLRLENRGPIGPKGERGRDGRDGPDGVRGEKGDEGPKGKPAPIVVGWETRPDAFEVVPIYSDGERGLPIHLLSLFQAFHDMTSWVEDVAVNEAAQESRKAIEAEAERARWAMR
jgi:hypothetical protein